MHKTNCTFIWIVGDIGLNHVVLHGGPMPLLVINFLMVGDIGLNHVVLRGGPMALLVINFFNGGPDRFFRKLKGCWKSIQRSTQIQYHI